MDTAMEVDPKVLTRAVPAAPKIVAPLMHEKTGDSGQVAGFPNQANQNDHANAVGIGLTDTHHSLTSRSDFSCFTRPQAQMTNVRGCSTAGSLSVILSREKLRE